MGAGPSPSVTGRRRGDARAAVFARRYLEALRVGEPAAALDAVQAALDAGLSVTEIHTQVIAPALRRIGRLWEEAVISAADEHLATAISQQALALLYPRLLAGRPVRPERILLAGVQGEHHVLGLRMAADVLEGEGFDVRWLGADVPAVELAAAVLEQRPDVVGLSLTLPLGASTLVGELRAVRRLHPGVRFLVGGQGVPRALRAASSVTYVEGTDRLAAAIGAALAAPAPEAIAMGIGGGGIVAPEAPGPEDTSVTGRLAATTAAMADAARAASRRQLELEREARLDPATGLMNGRACRDRILALRAAGTASGVVTVDLGEPPDGIDLDAVIAAVGRAVAATLREGDLAARCGARRLTVILAGAGPEDAARAAGRIGHTTARVLEASGFPAGTMVCAGYDAHRFDGPCLR